MRWPTPLLWSQEIILPAAMSSVTAPTCVEVSTAAMATATMEVPTTAEGEAERRAVAVIIGIRLIVRPDIITVAAKPSSAVPMTAMPPTTATAPVMYLLDVGRLRHL